MKRISSFLVLFMFILTFYIPVNAKTIGEVISTDITVFIDHQPIESFNIGGNTYIFASDLREYGFDVVWNENDRTVEITRNKNNPRKFLSVEKINRLKSDITVGKKIYNILSTDIVTYIGGKPTNACSINGKILIQISELSKFGYLNYSNSKRTVNLDMFRYDLDKAFKTVNKKAIILGEGITYEGEVKDGLPNGIGKKTVDIVEKNYPSKIIKMTYFGYYKNGEFNGDVISEGSIQVDGSSFRPNIQHQDYEHYQNGKRDGFCYHVNMPDYFGGLIRYDETYINGVRNGFCRESQYNTNYIYGYKVSLEGDYIDDKIIDYEPIDIENIKFSKVSVHTFDDISAVIEDGKMFEWGDYNHYNYKGRSVPIFTMNNVSTTSDGRIIGDSGGCYGSAKLVVDRDNNLHRITDEDKCIAKNVVYAEDQNYLDTNGVLWEDDLDGKGYYKITDNVKQFDSSGGYSSGGYVIFVKNDGTVWTMRCKALPNPSWNDGLDLSTPVKVMEDAKYVATSGLTNLVVKNDNTVWGWGISINGELGVFTRDDGTYDSAKANEITKPIKVAEGFVKVSIDGMVLAQKEDGSLWAWGYNGDGQLCNGETQDSSTPVKIMDGVKAFANNRYNGFSIKNDGTLWAWGDNSHGQLGIGSNMISSTRLVQVTKVCKRKKVEF